MQRVFFFLGWRRLARLFVIYFIFRIGPGVGVTQEPGVGVGVRTAPPRLRTPGDDSGARHMPVERRPPAWSH